MSLHKALLLYNLKYAGLLSRLWSCAGEKIILTVKNVSFYSMNFIDKQTFQKPECVLSTFSTHLITQVITQASPNYIIKKKKFSWLEQITYKT